MSTGFDLVTQNNSQYIIVLNVDSSNNNCLDTEFITPNPFLGQQFIIAPSESFTAHLYRKDGHGCDGHQGVFQARPAFIIDNHEVTQTYQQFSFDSHGSIGLVGTVPTYGSVLKQEGPAKDATWTISFE